MNYFAHARHVLDDPYRAAGAASPDWLNVLDRPCRLRARGVEPLAADGDPRVAAFAAGVLDHLADDRWFHASGAFCELSFGFTREITRSFPDPGGHRSWFVGHVLVELLLDAALIAAAPERLRRYYESLAAVDVELVQSIVRRAAGKPAAGLAQVVPMFRRLEFLWDYLDDAKLLVRLNQVLGRVGLRPFDASLAIWLPAARQAVAARADELLREPVDPQSSNSAGREPFQPA